MEKTFRNKFYHKYRKEIKCYSLLALPIILFSIFFVYGFVRGFVMSLMNYDLRFIIDEGLHFVGFENYKRVFSDTNFINGLLHTFIWTIVMLIGNNVFGLLMAVLIIKFGKKKNFFLAGLYWPALVSAAVGSQITFYLFNPTESGIMNIILKSFGVPPKDWLVDEKTALASLMFVPFFTGFSTKMLIYYAGIQSIPKAYYEAAKLETNSSTIIFAKITFPLLAPIIFLNVLLSLIDGLKVIAPMQLITPDNPYTISAIYALYLEAFSNTDFSYAFSMGFVMFIIIMIITAVQNKLKKETVVYE